MRAKKLLLNNNTNELAKTKTACATQSGHGDG
jgi:hypothetical protein